MRTETAKRCVVEINRFLEAWEEFQVSAIEESRLPQHDLTPPNKDWLYDICYCNRERAALRRASLDLSQALADLRQGR